MKTKSILSAIIILITFAVASCGGNGPKKKEGYGARCPVNDYTVPCYKAPDGNYYVGG